MLFIKKIFKRKPKSLITKTVTYTITFTGDNSKVIQLGNLTYQEQIEDTQTAHLKFAMKCKKDMQNRLKFQTHSIKC